MPTYEYQCASCGETFSAERPMADRKKQLRCQACGSSRTSLIPSCCSFTLVGGGWASSGYSTGGPKTSKGK